MSKMNRNDVRRAVHRRIRKRIHGTAERPRLAIRRSLNHIYAQAIDDDAGATVACASTVEKDVRGESGGNVAAAKKVGEVVGRRLKDKGIESVVFDRGGYLYHGRIKALAEGARESGLQF